MTRLCWIAMLPFVLLACGEKDQTLGADGKKVDGKPWQGAQNGFVDSGWVPGDKASWEQKIRTRGQNQNDYAKAN